MRQQKGFTLIELLVTLGLAGIIISIVMSLFIVNLKSYETINTESELQYQSQYIINYMTNKILGSKKIVFVNNNAATLDSSNEEDIHYISFKYGEDDSKCHNFEIKNNEIYYKDGSVGETSNEAFGSYVNELKITPISGNFKDVKSIEIYLKLQKDSKSKSYEATQIILMRNSQ